MSDLTTLHDDLGSTLKGFGGYLRCETCGHCAPLGSRSAIAGSLRSGWPHCCNLTMRWWTQSQIDAGEVPAAAGGTQNG